MDTSKSKVRRTRTEPDALGMHADGGGFDIRCTVGSVRFDDRGDASAYAQAFTLIGHHGSEGRFTFPHEMGGEVEVIVSHPIPADAHA